MIRSFVDKVTGSIWQGQLSHIQDLVKGMREADLEFKEAGRPRDEIRRLENEELRLPDAEQRAPRVGRSNASSNGATGISNSGKPGARKTRYGKAQRKCGR